MAKAMEMTELAKMSSKGQLVIPANIREMMELNEGSVVGITAKDDMIVLKKIDTKLKAEDLRTIGRLKEAWEDMEKGRFKSYSTKGFLKELERMKKSLE